MKLTIKRKPLGLYVYNEQLENVLKVHKPFLNQNLCEITTPDGKVEYMVARRVDKEGTQMIVRDGNGAEITCEISYQKDKTGKIVQTYLFQPPEPVSVKLKHELGEFCVSRVGDIPQKMVLLLNGQPCGMMEPMCNWSNFIISVEQPVSTSFITVLFVLGRFMVHDSDVDIV